MPSRPGSYLNFCYVRLLGWPDVDPEPVPANIEEDRDDMASSRGGGIPRGRGGRGSAGPSSSQGAVRVTVRFLLLFIIAF